MSDKKRRLTKREMWIFAVGQMGWSILGGIINAWLVTFYLPTSGDIAKGATQFIRPGFIVLGLTILGIIAAVCRIFDAVTDPLIASLSDRSKKTEISLFNDGSTSCQQQAQYTQTPILHRAKYQRLHYPDG